MLVMVMVMVMGMGMVMVRVMGIVMVMVMVMVIILKKFLSISNNKVVQSLAEFCLSISSSVNK